MIISVDETESEKAQTEYSIQKHFSRCDCISHTARWNIVSIKTTVAIALIIYGVIQYCYRLGVRDAQSGLARKFSRVGMSATLLSFVTGFIGVLREPQQTYGVAALLLRRKIRMSGLCLLLILCGFTVSAEARPKTLHVGPSSRYATPCAAILKASRGDTIEIDTTGKYDGDVCGWSTNNLTIRGVGPGRAIIKAAGKNWEGKGIWVIAGNDTTVENIEFADAIASDGNGAGIRQEGTNLIIRNCYFHDNQEGILAGNDPKSTVLVEFSEFARNGTDDGSSHNIYVNHVAKLIFRYNYSHESIVGHLLKSRAAENVIAYNRLTDEPTGTGSYELDLPNGGNSLIIGNLIEQGPKTENNTILAYLEEGVDRRNLDHQLFVINNTFVNDCPLGDNIFVFIGKDDLKPALIENNILTGPGVVTNQRGALLKKNFIGNPQFVDANAFDFHLLNGSPAVDAGSDTVTADGLLLTPQFQYVHPACAEGRSSVGKIDIGAYERGGRTAAPPPHTPSRCSIEPRGVD